MTFGSGKPSQVRVDLESDNPAEMKRQRMIQMLQEIILSFANLSQEIRTRAYKALGQLIDEPLELPQPLIPTPAPAGPVNIPPPSSPPPSNKA
jgi:hypothetical protein